jgi:hypothetical protein
VTDNRTIYFFFDRLGSARLGRFETHAAIHAALEVAAAFAGQRPLQRLSISLAPAFRVCEKIRRLTQERAEPAENSPMFSLGELGGLGGDPLPSARSEVRSNRPASSGSRVAHGLGFQFRMTVMGSATSLGVSQENVGHLGTHCTSAYSCPAVRHSLASRTTQPSGFGNQLIVPLAAQTRHGPFWRVGGSAAS